MLAKTSKLTPKAKHNVRVYCIVYSTLLFRNNQPWISKCLKYIWKYRPEKVFLIRLEHPLLGLSVLHPKLFHTSLFHWIQGVCIHSYWWPQPCTAAVFVKLHSKLRQGTGLAEKKPKTKQGRRKKIKVMGFPAFALCVAHKSLEVEERNCPLA